MFLLNFCGIAIFIIHVIEFIETYESYSFDIKSGEKFKSEGSPWLGWDKCQVEEEGCLADNFYYYPENVTHSTLSGVAAYRSSLTLDWLAAEDSRQRELASAFETEIPPAKVISTDCIAYPRPAPGKIGRLMLELLKNLEGDEANLITELIKILIRTKLLMETSILETEPDFEALVKTPGIMAGEPHTTFPRIVAVLWMLVTDPTTTRKYGWCPVGKVNKFLMVSKRVDIAKQMRSLDLVVARARFIMEEFIQNVAPMNMYQKKNRMKTAQLSRDAVSDASVLHAMRPRAHEKVALLPRTSSSVLPKLLTDLEERIVSNDGVNFRMKLLLSLPFVLLAH